MNHFIFAYMHSIKGSQLASITNQINNYRNIQSIYGKWTRLNFQRKIKTKRKKNSCVIVRTNKNDHLNFIFKMRIYPNLYTSCLRALLYDLAFWISFNKQRFCFVNNLNGETNEWNNMISSHSSIKVNLSLFLYLQWNYKHVCWMFTKRQICTNFSS